MITKGLKELNIKCFLSLLVASCLIAIVGGCARRQDNNIAYVGNISLRCYGSAANSPRPDRFKYEGAGGVNTDTYFCCFFWIAQLLDAEDTNFKAGGLIYNVRINKTSGPLGTDIFNQDAPIGQPYGWISLNPAEYDREEEPDPIVYGEFTENGEALSALMLGGPRGHAWQNLPTDVRWEWPELSDMIIDTLVEMTLTVPRKGIQGGPITVDFWAYFHRSQWQGFLNPYGGIYSGSEQGIGTPDLVQLKEMLLNDMKSNMPASVAEAILENCVEEVTEKLSPKDRHIDYPSANEKSAKAKSMATLSGSVDQIDFQQLRWEDVEPDGWGWYYFDVQPDEKLYAVYCDPNDPNQILRILRWAEPYCWHALVTPPESFKGKTGKFTSYLRAVDDLNNYDPTRDIPIVSYVIGVDGSQLELRSKWWIPTSDPDLHGLYYDEWGNPIIMLYMPAGTHPMIIIPEYGNFDNDENIDTHDLALFAENWLGYNGCILDSDRSSVIDYPDLGSFCDLWLAEDCNDSNNACHVYDLDENGSIDFNDFAIFSGYWMNSTDCGPTGELNYDGSFDDPNNWNGSINFSDFSIFAQNWMENL